MTYFSIIPSELILELSLYFDYRDTVLYCQLLRCNDIRFWLHKIQKELGYSKSFITEYVYNIDNGIKRTPLPLNEKYLELKSRKSVDFGTEYYKATNVLIQRIGRIKDHKRAIDLTKYFLYIIDITFPDFIKIINTGYFEALTEGAISVKNLELVDFLMAKTKKQYAKGEEHAFLSLLSQPIVSGLYEGSVNGIPDEKFKNYVYEKYLVKPHYYTQKDIISGLARGGHLKALIDLKVDRDSNLAELGQAVEGGHKNITDKYQLMQVPGAYDVAITWGHLHLIPANLDAESLKEVILAYIREGYLEQMMDYTGSLNATKLYSSFIATLLFNHLDVTRTFYEIWGPNTKHVINIMFSSELIDTVVRCTLDTFKFLVENDLVTTEQLKLVIEKYGTEMQKTNPDALDYIKTVVS